MIELPANLTLFSPLTGLSQILAKSELSLLEAHQLNDPFLPDASTELSFTKAELFEQTVKYIVHAVLGKSPPRGQPNHSLQKAIMRWRLQDRFNNETEIKTALQGLLPALVEKEFEDASELHKTWQSYVTSKQVLPLYEKFQSLELWQHQGFSHKGVAIKFKCPEDSIFRFCHKVNYQKVPAIAVDKQQHIEHLVGAIATIDYDLQAILLNQNYSQRELKEWRLIVDSNNYSNQAIQFPLSLIQSIYVGALVSDQNCLQLKQHLAKQHPEINLYRAFCKVGEYNLDFEKISMN